MMQPVVFSAAAQAMLSGHVVRAAFGAWFDFTSGPERVWLGEGTYIATDGTVWSGLGGFASIDGEDLSWGLSTDSVTLKLSGLDPSFVSETRAQAKEIRGRKCGIYQLLRDSNEQSLDAPYLVQLYFMDNATFSVDGGTDQLIISMTIEPLFTTKHLPAFALVTDQDQQRKFPGDKIFERIALLSGRQTTIWAS
jgi:hypothetical protein